MTKTLHPERIARLLLTTALPDGVDAAAVVSLVDAGASRSRVYAATEKLIGEAWAGAGREAAAATKPKAVKQAQERLRGVAQLETLLGLAPSDAADTPDEPVSDTDPEPADEPEPAALVPASSWGAA